VTEAIEKIRRLERAVVMRKRLLAARHAVALAVLISGFASAGAILYVRLRPIDVPAWAIVASVFAVVSGVLLGRVIVNRVTFHEAAFLIDGRLKLDDRLTTAHSIIERGAPVIGLEEALIDDTAARIAAASSTELVPLRVPRWYGISVLSVAALVVAVTIPEGALPGGEAVAAARADIREAGERLEQEAGKIEQTTAPDSKTAELAREQAEMGRAFRRGTHSRSEALTKLSALGERIRQRRDELAGTRADEIVSLAEKRLRSALAPEPKRKPSQEKQTDEAGADLAAANVPEAGSTRKNATGDRLPQEAGKQSEVSAKSTELQGAEGAAAKQTAKSSEPKPGQPNAQPDARTDSAQLEAKKNEQGAAETAEPKSSEQKLQSQGDNPSARESTNRAPGDAEAQREKSDEGSPLPSGLTGLATEQAAKALPALSQQLLKQAEQLRLNQLKAEDIERLRKAAESLSRDLASIAQSKEFQQSLEQLARQVTPEDIERVAKQLMGNEELRRELQAAAQLLAENRQAKEIVAGLAQGLAGLKDQRPPDPDKRQAARQSPPNSDESSQRGDETNGAARGRMTAGKGSPKPGDAKILQPLTGQGSETRLAGAKGRGAGGEYLYLQSKAGAGAVRVPYVAAYPQYRREAERSIERSHVPQRMRSLVRSYFDSINPDAKK